MQEDVTDSEMQEECCKSLILKQWYHYIVKFSFSLIFLVLAYWENNAFLVCMIKDIDQTDLHRSEPSSRTDLRDEHSHQ